MASTSLRSSRSRRPGLATRSSTRNNVAVRPGSDKDKNAYITPQLANIGRKKRPRDDGLHEDLPLKAKRSKIAIEILQQQQQQPKAKPQPQTRSLAVKSRSNTNTRSDVAPLRSAPEQPEKSVTTTTTAPEPAPEPQKPTKHHLKVANGIRHEIDKLQPNPADLQCETRKLRSQEGTRFKSELSAYFPEYDEVIGNEPKEEHILNYETPIAIIDTAKPKTHPPATRKTTKTHEYPLKDFPSALFDDINDAHAVDFSFVNPEDGEEDPLSDAYFALIHRKPERQERTLRNTDRGRAQHEKDQVNRLLEGLQGHDWLKLMGVSGITESKKKDFEQARTYFIKGCEGILEKFRLWKEEEKKRKLEKELAVAEAEAEGGEEEQGDCEGEKGAEEGNESDGDPPDYSDVDASAARQLHEEATARSKAQQAAASKKAGKRRKPTPPPVREERRSRSASAKPQKGAKAPSKPRQSGRTAMAWGHPIPELPQRDFDLPEEYRDEETLKARARAKRRQRRVSKD